MGGIVKSLFGGGSSKSSNQSTSSSNTESGNKSWEMISEMLSPAVQTGANALGDLGGILSQGFDDYKKNAGFDFLYNQGTRNITGSAASKGLLNSGSTAKALTQFSGELGSTMYNNWLDRLAGVAQVGIGASAPLVGAGSWSKGTSTSQSSGTGTGSDYGKGIIGTLFG